MYVSFVPCEDTLELNIGVEEVDLQMWDTPGKLWGVVGCPCGCAKWAGLQSLHTPLSWPLMWNEASKMKSCQRLRNCSVGNTRGR